jgi:hypothetical protein
MGRQTARCDLCFFEFSLYRYTAAAALLRKRDKEQREEMDDVTYALTQKTLQLQLAVKERAAAAETLNVRESELYHVRGLLASLRREHAVGAVHFTRYKLSTTIRYYKFECS